MTRDELSVRDPIDIEREQPERTADLRRLLADFDDDHDDFAAEVRERVQRRAASAEPREGPALSVGLRRAAAALPPLLLPKGLAKLGVGGGGALLGKGGGLLGKGGLTGLAVLPAVTGLMLLLSLWIVVRSMVRPADAERQAQDREWAQAAVRQFWRENLPAVGLTVAALLGLVFVAPAEAITLAMIVSTVALCLVFARLAESGLASRYEIGVRAGGAMTAAVGYGFSFLRHDWLTSLGVESGAVVLPLLWVGAVVCVALARAGTRPKRRRALNIQLGLLALIALVIACLQVFVGPRAATRADYDRWLATPEGITDKLDWGAVEQVERLHRAAGEAPPVRDGQRARAREDIERRALNGAYDQLPLLALGLVEDDILRAWFDERALQRLIDRTSTRWAEPHDDFVYRLAHALDRLPSDARDAAVERLLADLPEPDEHQALEDLVLAARTLEALGRPDAIPGLQDLAHATLRANWVHDVAAQRGGFAPSPQLAASSAERKDGHAEPSGVWMDATAAGVEALVRWGIPRAVDVLDLERFLHDETAIYGSDDFFAGEALAFAGLLAVRALPGYGAALESRASRPVWELLWAWRMAVATLLLVTLAVVATWRAPVREVEDEPTALDWGDWWSDVRIRSGDPS